LQPFCEYQTQRATFQVIEDEETGIACVYRVEYDHKKKQWARPEFCGYGPPAAAALKLVQLANQEWTAQKKYSANKAKEEKQVARAVELAKKNEAKRIEADKAADKKAAALAAHHDASNVAKHVKKAKAKPAPRAAKKPSQALKLHQANGKAPQAAKAKQRRAMAS
jgi:hypothetical protein